MLNFSIVYLLHSLPNPSLPTTTTNIPFSHHHFLRLLQFLVLGAFPDLLSSILYPQKFIVLGSYQSIKHY